MKILIATQNEHKKIEMYDIFSNYFDINGKGNQFNKKIELFTLKDFGFDREIDENGNSFIENAKIKTYESYRFLKENGIEKEFGILGDDSGLVIEDITNFYNEYRDTKIFQEIIEEAAFDENNIKFWQRDLTKIQYLPGIYSKRFGYIDEQKKRNSYVLKLLSLIEEKINKNISRKAYFNTYIYYKDLKREFSVNGKVEGVINRKPVGENGFGYDPIFFVPELNKTLAQLTLSEKNKVSHRSRALKKFIEKIIEEF